MAYVTVTLNTAQVTAQLTGPGGAVAQHLMRVGNRVMNGAKRRCPVDEGKLRASITMTLHGSGRGLTVRVGSNLDYAIYVHEGTGIYAGRGPIRPRAGKYLRFPVKNNSGSGRRRYKGGRTAGYVFAKQVRGVPPRPFLREALEQDARV